LFRWKQENGNINILQTKSCDNLVDLFTKSLPYSLFQKCVEGIGMRRLKWLQGSGGVILHDIWPVLYHHIILFSLHEFCLVKVFSSKNFNEVISTKLYASSLIFPTGVFMHDDYKHIFLLEVSVSSTHDPKDIVYSLFFPQGFWGDDILKDKLQMIKWTWIDQRGVLQNMLPWCDQPLSVLSQGTHPLGDTVLYLYINSVLSAIKTTVTSFWSRFRYSPTETT
jgi:hypothetical protein